MAAVAVSLVSRGVEKAAFSSTPRARRDVPSPGFVLASLRRFESLPSGSANDPFHPVVSAAKISVFVILRERPRHVLSM